MGSPQNKFTWTPSAAVSKPSEGSPKNELARGPDTSGSPRKRGYERSALGSGNPRSPKEALIWLFGAGQGPGW